LSVFVTKKGILPKTFKPISLLLNKKEDLLERLYKRRFLFLREISNNALLLLLKRSLKKKYLKKKYFLNCEALNLSTIETALIENLSLNTSISSNAVDAHSFADNIILYGKT